MYEYFDVDSPKYYSNQFVNMSPQPYSMSATTANYLGAKSMAPLATTNAFNPTTASVFGQNSLQELGKNYMTNINNSATNTLTSSLTETATNAATDAAANAGTSALNDANSLLGLSHGSWSVGLQGIGLGLQGWQAWNAYDQGRKQLELARETLDFNKTQAEKENERYDEQKRQRDEAHAKISSAADVWNRDDDLPMNKA